MQAEAIARSGPEPPSDVVIVRWPEEASSVQRLRTLGRPRLLLVAPDAVAPATVECDEDWIRLPAEDADVRVRITTLAARAARHSLPPEVKGDGRLSYRGRWVGLTGGEEGVARVLSEHFGEVVDHDTVEAAASVTRQPTPNGLRVTISRLRKRIAPLGLAVRRVHNRGYVMDIVMDMR
jgi:two-component system OmpR family response regulator